MADDGAPGVMVCQHEQFGATVNVNRITHEGEPLRFAADVKIRCNQCGEPFRFLGVDSGLSFERPMTSIDGLELRAPIEPELVPMLAARAVFHMPPEIPHG